MSTGGYGAPGDVEEEIRVVRAIYDAFARRDLDAALGLIDEDIEFLPQVTAAMTGRAEPYRGHAGIREYFADAERLWEDLTLHATDIRAAAGSVVVFGHVEGRTGGELLRRHAMWTWRVRDGRACALRVTDLGDAAEG